METTMRNREPRGKKRLADKWSFHLSYRKALKLGKLFDAIAIDAILGKQYRNDDVTIRNTTIPNFASGERALSLSKCLLKLTQTFVASEQALIVRQARRGIVSQPLYLINNSEAKVIHNSNTNQPLKLTPRLRARMITREIYIIRGNKKGWSKVRA